VCATHFADAHQKEYFALLDKQGGKCCCPITNCPGHDKVALEESAVSIEDDKVLLIRGAKKDSFKDVVVQQYGNKSHPTCSICPLVPGHTFQTRKKSHQVLVRSLACEPAASKEAAAVVCATHFADAHQEKYETLFGQQGGKCCCSITNCPGHDKVELELPTAVNSASPSFRTKRKRPFKEKVVSDSDGTDEEQEACEGDSD
jgi:hypothetical protein